MFGSISYLLTSGIMHPGQRILLVTSLEGSKRRSAAFIRHLLQAKLNCAVYNHIANEPSLINVENGLTMLNRTKCNTVVAVGGCTPIDVAKKISETGASLITIPTIPCGGMEKSKIYELFDWETEEIITSQLENDFISIVDSQLALDDKIDRKTDLIAFISTLSFLLNQAPESNESLVINDALEACEMGLKAAEQRDKLFQASLLIDRSRGDSLNSSITKTICSKIALPRNLIQAFFFLPCIKLSLQTDPEVNKLLQSIPLYSRNERIFEDLVLASKIPSSLYDLLKNFVRDEQMIDDTMIEILGWIEKISKDKSSLLKSFII